MHVMYKIVFVVTGECGDWHTLLRHGDSAVLKNSIQCILAAVISAIIYAAHNMSHDEIS